MKDDDSHLNGLQPDIYGQVHPVETDEFVSAKMADFDAELTSTSEADKKFLKMAQEKCPEFLTKEFRLSFLRCEMFRVKHAVKRYCYYWNRRVDVFGLEKAFLPLTLDGALKDDLPSLRRGAFTLLPSKDPMGRAFVFFDPSLQDSSKYPRHSMVRAFWYVLHAALEDESAQKHGIVFLVWPHRAKFSQFDQKLSKANVSAIKGAIPIRMAGIHICQPPSFLSIILPIVKIFMGERLRKRINVHTGDIEKVHSNLLKYGITPKLLPSDLDGEVQLDREAWADSRAAQNK